MCVYTLTLKVDKISTSTEKNLKLVKHLNKSFYLYRDII